MGLGRRRRQTDVNARHDRAYILLKKRARAHKAVERVVGDTRFELVTSGM